MTDLKNILPTFSVEQFVNDNGVTKFRVIDNYTNLEVGNHLSIDSVIATWKPYADHRTK